MKNLRFDIRIVIGILCVIFVFLGIVFIGNYETGLTNGLD